MLELEAVEKGLVHHQGMPHWGSPRPGKGPDEGPNVVYTQVKVTHPWYIGS